MADMIAGVPPAGGYLSLAKIIFMLVLVAPWLYAAAWVHKDTKIVRARQTIWSLSVVGACALGVLLWFLVPIYIVGLLLYLLLTGGALAAYVLHRNGRVPEDQRVLTRQHLWRLLAHRKAQHVEAVTRVKLYNCDNKIVLPPDERAPEAQSQAYNLTQELLYDVIWRRALIGVDKMDSNCGLNASGTGIPNTR